MDPQLGGHGFAGGVCVVVCVEVCGSGVVRAGSVCVCVWLCVHVSQVSTSDIPFIK